MAAIQIAKVFEPLFTTSKRLILLSSGRAGGKSTVGVDYALLKIRSIAKRDIIVCRDSYSDLSDSLYSAMLNYIYRHGLSREFVAKKDPLRIRNTRTGGNIYFLGIGGADMSRTKSFQPENPVEVVIFEEVQQIREQQSLEQAHSSFRRHLSQTGVLLHMFNPPPQNGHWVNVFWNIKKHDPDWLCIKSSYLDIAQWLNDLDLREILKTKLYEPEKHDWMYLGIPGGGFGTVFPQFKRDKHLIPFASAKEKFKGMRIASVIIGGDNAVTHDMTALVPYLCFSNGQTLVADIFVHNPLTSGQKSVAELLPYMLRWLAELEKKYNLSDPLAITPIAFVIDGSVIGQELVKQLRFKLPDRYDVLAYTKKNILEMAGNMQSALARNMIYVADYGGHYNYTHNRFERRENILAEQFENVIWNEKQNGYEPLIPNDVLDAAIYGGNSIFRNMFNLYYIEKGIKARKDFYDLDAA